MPYWRRVLLAAWFQTAEWFRWGSWVQFVIRSGGAIVLVVVSGALFGPPAALSASGKIFAGFIVAAVLFPVIYIAAIVTAAAKIDRENNMTIEALRRSLANMNGRQVKQAAVDALAVLRKEGVVIYANGPTSRYGTAEWEQGRTDWRDRVVAHLERNFTQAEALSFGHLGEIPGGRKFEHAIDTDHARYLAQLTKQLAILEGLIERYQDKLRVVARDP